MRKIEVPNRVKGLLKPVDQSRDWLVAHKGKIGRIAAGAAFLAANAGVIGAFYIQNQRIENLELQSRISAAEARVSENVDVNTLTVVCRMNVALGMDSVDCDEFSQEFLQLRRQKVLDIVLEGE